MAGDDPTRWRPIIRGANTPETVFGVQREIDTPLAKLDALIADLSDALHEREGGGSMNEWIKKHGGAVVALATALGAAAVNLGAFGGDSTALHILTVGATGIAFVERVLQAFIAGASK